MQLRSSLYSLPPPRRVSSVPLTPASYRRVRSTTLPLFRAVMTTGANQSLSFLSKVASRCLTHLPPTESMSRVALSNLPWGPSRRCEGSAPFRTAPIATRAARETPLASHQTDTPLPQCNRCRVTSDVSSTQAKQPGSKPSANSSTLSHLAGGQTFSVFSRDFLVTACHRAMHLIP